MAICPPYGGWPLRAHSRRPRQGHPELTENTARSGVAIVVCYRPCGGGGRGRLRPAPCLAAACMRTHTECIPAALRRRGAAQRPLRDRCRRPCAAGLHRRRCAQPGQSTDPVRVLQHAGSAGALAAAPPTPPASPATAPTCLALDIDMSGCVHAPPFFCPHPLARPQHARCCSSSSLQPRGASGAARAATERRG